MKDRLLKNIVTDLLMFVAMLLTSISGFLIKFIIRRNSDVSHILGMGRSVWRDIHIWAGVVLLVLLVVHIVQHWRMVDACVCKYITNKSARMVLYMLLAIMLSATVLPWVAMVV